MSQLMSDQIDQLKWTSVKNTLPEYDRNLVGYDENDATIQYVFCSYGEWEDEMGKKHISFFEVTHPYYDETEETSSVVPITHWSYIYPHKCPKCTCQLFPELPKIL